MGLFRNKEKGREVLEQAPGERKTKKEPGFLGKLWKEKPWLSRGLVVSFTLGLIFSGFYGIYRTRAEKFQDSPAERTESIAWLYQSCYLLYRDLYNARQEDNADYVDVYLEAKEGYEWLLDGKKFNAYRQILDMLAETSEGEEYVSGEEMETDWVEEALHNGTITEEMIAEYASDGLLDKEWLEDYRSGGSYYNLNHNDCYAVLNEIEMMKGYFLQLESSFRELNISYDYVIEDNTTGKILTNSSEEERNRDKDLLTFLLIFRFDRAGNVTIGDSVQGKDVNAIRKSANEVVRADLLKTQLNGEMSTFLQYGRLKGPADCTVTFSIPMADWETRKDNFYIGSVESNGNSQLYYGCNRYWGNDVYAYWDSGVGSILVLAMALMALLGCFLPVLGKTKPWREEKLCYVSLEVLFLAGVFLCLMTEPIMTMVAYVASGEAGGAFRAYLQCPLKVADFLAWFFSMWAMAFLFFGCWYVGICARAVRDFGVWTYIRKRSLIYRFFPFIKRKAVSIYDAVAHMDLTENANKTIIKILVGNALILLVISFFWVGGFAITAVYSIVLYIILRKYISELQKSYRVLLRAVDQIAAGCLNVTINEDLGVFEPFREQVFKIQDGLQKAVEAEVKSQRMKVELVTNMSHDLKTPLTAIITYVNLLKEEGITEQQRKEYLTTLERKSLRLKSLIEDLFEFSKASSQNVTLNIMDVDIMSLVKQVAFEMSDKLGEAGLDVRMNLTEEKVILPLDSQKTYRIYENLFGNISKYALPGTRVYVNGFRIDDTVVITLKNISAQEITVDSSELTERFVRGDAARNTEGSGLGLAIAKSFTELQGGSLALDVDGDLFKVTTTWYLQVAEADSYKNLPPFQM